MVRRCGQLVIVWQIKYQFLWSISEYCFGHASWNIVSYFEVDICIVYISVLTFHERAMSSGSFNSDRFQTRPQWGHPSDYCGEFCGLFCIFSFPHNKHTHTDLHTISRTNICIQFLPLSHLHVMILLQGGGACCYNDPHTAQKAAGFPRFVVRFWPRYVYLCVYTLQPYFLFLTYTFLHMGYFCLAKNNSCANSKSDGWALFDFVLVFQLVGSSGRLT